MQTPEEQLLQESQTWLDQYQAVKRADLGRLQSEHAKLEAKRTELTDRVSRNNADRGSQQELNRTEEAIEAVKQQIHELRIEVRATIISRRRDLAETLNQRIMELEKQVSEKRSEKERIRTELLPALERQREELIEQGRSIENDILHLTENISRLSRITIESEDLEFD